MLDSKILKKQQVFIFGYYGWKNTGDDAMLYVLLQELPKTFPEAEFIVLSHIPVVIPTSSKNKVRFVKPAVIPALSELLRSQIFIIGGGTHIHDYGQGIRIIKILLRLLIIVALAKLSGNKVYLIGNGIGPITTRMGRFFARIICSMSDYITARDKISYQTLGNLGLANDRHYLLGFDLAALLKVEQDKRNNLGKTNSNLLTLGICVTSIFAIYYCNHEKDLVLIDEIAKALNIHLAKTSNLNIHLFVFKEGQKDSDVHLTQLLKKRLGNSGRVKLIPYNSDPRETLNQVTQCDLFIGTKYHSCIFAYISHVPLLVIDYHPKCSAFAKEVGLPDYAIVSLQDIIDGKFISYLNHLVNHPNEFLARLPINVAETNARNSLYFK
ncbi:polysaccharide pyruvyl transferase family protein [Chloroflexota bacterium]